jgi:DNA-binding SARP family transcriptional activator
MAPSVHKSFRFEPTTADADRVIARPRVAVALAQRFEYRLTTLVAAAGYGKTTALAQSVRSNALDPIGRDIWLGASEADSDPLSLLAGLLESCGLEGSGHIETDLASLSDHVWGLAPDRVSLIIDDAHHLTDTCSTTIEDLLTRLPTNAHLLLSGRSIPTLAVADLQAHHDVLELTHEDLRLDDQEARVMIAARGRGELATLSRHAASADIGLAAGPDATSAYLWQEILRGLEPARLRVLAALSLLPELDDTLALAHSGGSYDAASLTAGLPLVETHDDDSKRMHALLCQPLSETLDQEQRVAALITSGDVEQGRGRYDQAVSLYTAAGRTDLAERVAREFATLPTLRTRLDSVRSIRKSVGCFAEGSALHQHLDAQSRLNLDAGERIERFVHAANLARDEGDGHIEAVAVFRAIQAANDHKDPLPRDLLSRIDTLASTVSYAEGVRAYMWSLEIQAAGNSRGAIDALRGTEVLGDETLVIMRAERFCDLGRPEDVFADLSPSDLAGLPPGAEIFISFAMWLRGDASPEDALAIGSAMLPGILSRGVLQPSISILSVVAHIALAAGDMEAAERYASELTDLCAGQSDVRTNLFSAMAQASLLSARGNDGEAAKILDPDTTGVSFGNWPARPMMVGLPLVYLNRPETRSVLRRCTFGPALATAVAAGIALVELRDNGSVDGAVALPWNEEWVLRAHVLPRHLAELAAAAASEGSPAAETLLSKLPNTRRGLERLEAGGRSRAARWAGQFLGQLPPESPYPLRVNALGPLEVVRDGRLVRDKDWTRRVRVRELLAAVVEQRSIGRDGACALLWPDLSTSKASSNLRVTLSHLQGVLEPDRASHTGPSFLLVGSAGLVLSDDVDVDVEEFERLLQRAQTTDRAGAPAEAIALYREALGLYRGPYMADLDAPWAAITRLRLDSLARTSMTRLGALELARGEPERALHWAAEAQKASEIDERAGRLFMSALRATGDRAGAAAAGTRLVAALRSAGLEPEPATARLLEEYGITC